MIILDSNHLTALRARGRVGLRLEARLNEAILHKNEDITTTIISVQESLTGWLSKITDGRSKIEKQVAFYDKLHSDVEYYGKMSVLVFDDRAAAEYKRIQLLGINMGDRDRKIAAVALTTESLLLSEDIVFTKVPNLNVADWLADEIR